MDSSSIELNGTRVESIDLIEGALRIHLAPARIVKTMTGSAERTRWQQTGDLIIECAEVETRPPSGPLTCVGGDLDDNIYTYRDMIPIPLSSRGRIGCRLRFEGVKDLLIASGDAVRLEMQDVPKYIEHIRPGDTRAE